MVNKVGKLKHVRHKSPRPHPARRMVNQVDKLEAAMPLDPLYNNESIRPAYQLRYSWTGWLKAAWPDMPDLRFLDTIDPLWEGDGLRRLEQTYDTDHFQITFSAKPNVTPVFLAARAKGRLQYLLRNASQSFPGFTRKVSVRSVGQNTSKDVTAYIASQVAKEAYDDSRFRTMLAQFTRIFPSPNLAEANDSARGRYWYNLHIVLVTASRVRFRDSTELRKLYEQTLKIADRKGHKIVAISVIPDHLHLALRGHIEQSPQEIALGFQNNLAYTMGQQRIWQDGYYAGTFGEYDMDAIRRNAALADVT